MNNLVNDKTIVFKVGTSTLTYPNGKPNIRRMSRLVSVLADLENSGREIILVSSGAIAVGMSKMKIDTKPKNVDAIQATACVGQSELMFLYDKFFSEYNLIIGQLLITKEDVDDEKRCANLMGALNNMREYGVIPIINENDAIAVDEIVFGDNDTLSATIARLINADALVLLTDIDGFFTSNPSEDPDAKLLSVVEEIDEDIINGAGDAGSKRGTGGMITKVKAASIATKAGIDCVIMNGSDPEDIYKLFEGRRIGTFFKANDR